LRVARVPPSSERDARRKPHEGHRPVRRARSALAPFPRHFKELGGHGIGRTIHEPPSVPNYADFTAQHKLTEGLVITIEPIISAGTERVVLDRDGWKYRMADGSLSAHYEHTVVITRGKPLLLTAA